MWKDPPPPLLPLHHGEARGPANRFRMRTAGRRRDCSKRGGLAPPCRGWLPNIPPIGRLVSMIWESRRSCVYPSHLGDMHPAIVATNVARPDPRLSSQIGRRLQAKQYWRNWATPGILVALGVFHTVKAIETIPTEKMLLLGKSSTFESTSLEPSTDDQVDSTFGTKIWPSHYTFSSNLNLTPLRWRPTLSRTDPSLGYATADKDSHRSPRFVSIHSGTAQVDPSHLQFSSETSTSLHTHGEPEANCDIAHRAPCDSAWLRAPPDRSPPPRGLLESQW